MSESGIAKDAEPVTAETLDPRELEALEVLTEICRVSGLSIQAEPKSRHSPYLDVELVGEDIADSYGKNGQTLDSLQYLANLVVGRRVGPDVRFILDACGYRARRHETLVSLAQEFAAQVKERQEECELDPLPAHERRIIHNALSGDDGIRTYSEGDDPDRRVIIAPR